MRTVIGQVVRGDNFWPRPEELQDIWNAIEQGSHVLLAAPRRVGKTSIMYKLIDEPKDGYILMYINTESADNQQEFWQKLFHALAEESFLSGLKTKASIWWQKLVNIKINKISMNSVEFGDGQELSFVDAFKKLVTNLDSEQKLIVMIDEFAQTIENISKYEDDKNAISLLKNHRELRQDARFSDKVTFVYAGSIGLESVVAKLDATRHINDLNSIKIKPLDHDHARQFATRLFAFHNKTISANTLDYLLTQIEWLIPFYIQLMVQETVKILRDNQEITQGAIDGALHEAPEHKQYFESWLSKIKTSFKNQEFIFAKQVLNNLSEQQTISFSQIVNIAAKHKMDEEEARGTLRSLIYDGYINNNDDPKIYRFNSPILRTWWYKNVAN